ncbi:MAG: IS66 family insertion sequence element accessory protein TnpA [Dermatophilaceae bacterium]
MRKRRSAEQWGEIVERWRASGESAREFATHEGVVPGTLSWWGNRLKTDVARRARVAKGTEQAFTQLRVTGSSSSSSGGRVEVVTPSGLVVRVTGAVSEADLVAVLRAVQQC